MKRRALGLIVLLLAASMTVGCGGISALFCGRDSTPEGLVTADLLGEYHGDEGATLVLEPEGTFVAVDLHQRDFHLDADVTTSGAGTWGLEQWGDREPHVELNFVERDSDDEWHFNISRNRENPRLWYYYGDADACFRKALNRDT